ncbi:MAG: HAMP domain-containing histidine kinase [Planctomycetaceae bacterium]|nr:HAMP domain-containing histidine kinase [Planctomycetaceae bacterium]
MATYFRRRSSIHLPITLSVSLMALNVTLMVCWIVLLAQRAKWTALTIGVLAFTLILAGLSVWLVLTLKEIALNNRQANFVDSVTHELKSPIAALQLYLETLRMRQLTETQRDEFHGIMATELKRLDQLINQLLEVGRLDALGENEEPVVLELEPLLRQMAESVCAHRGLNARDVFQFRATPLAISARRIVLELILSNLLDNAVKYGGSPAEVIVDAYPVGSRRLKIRISNNGAGVPLEDRKKIFRIFYRGGSELERRQKGTGLGLYIVHTLVKKMRGRVTLQDRDDGAAGCTFVIELPGRVELQRPQPSPQPESQLQEASR